MNRQILRRVYTYLDECFPGTLAPVKILPISSIEWTSEYRSINENKIIIFDTEQSNAMDYILYRTFSLERPIFIYNEFSIRAAEILLGFGDKASALRIAKLSESRLADYCHDVHSFPFIERPVSYEGIDTFSNVASVVSSSFLLGHEIGHFLAESRKGPSDSFAHIEDHWRAHEFVDQSFAMAGAEARSIRMPRFFQPDIIQNFDDEGVPSGNAVIATSYTSIVDAYQESMIEESKSDLIAIYAATKIALDNGITANILLFSIFNHMITMEKLLLLRNAASRLPRGKRRSSITFEGSRLGSRLFILNYIVHGIYSGKLTCPNEMHEYWRTLPDDQVRGMADSAVTDSVSTFADLPSIVCRGAVYLGAGGKFPDNLDPPEKVIQRFGPIAGNVLALAAPFRLPKTIYDITQHSRWHPDSGVDANLTAFACVIRDLASSLICDQETGEAKDEVPDDWQALLAAVRSPRTLLYRQRVD